MQKYKNELMIVQKKLELSSRENERLRRQLGKQENAVTDLKEKMKVAAVGVKSEKDDSRQALTKMEQKVAQTAHEARKKEAQFARIQEQYRKAMKESVPYKNGFDILSKLGSDGLEGAYKHVETCGMPAAHQLVIMLKAGYEATQQRLVEENGRLKDCINMLQSEMAEMLNSVIASFKGKLTDKEHMNEVKCLEPIHIKPIVFQMSLGQIVNDIYQILRENLCRLKDALETLLTLSH